LFVALGMVYMLVTNWMNSKKHGIKETMELFKMLFFGLIILGVAAILVAVF